MSRIPSFGPDELSIKACGARELKKTLISQIGRLNSAIQAHCMAYSHFKSLTQVMAKFNLKFRAKKPKVFTVAPPVEVSETLNASLAWEKTQDVLYKGTESDRIYRVILPLLLEVETTSETPITVSTQYRLDIENMEGLNGFCDVIIHRDQKTEEFPESAGPIILVVEAKRKDLEKGVPQYVAEMVAASRYNTAIGAKHEKVYGIVSTGLGWIFLKLKNNEIIKDPKVYTISDIAAIKGMVTAIVTSGHQH